MSLNTCVTVWAVQLTHKPALLFDEEVISYGQLTEAIETRARQLVQLGVSRGDRLAFLGYNHPELLYLLFACASLGAIMVPLNWRLTAPEHQAVLNDAGVRLLFAQSDFAVHAQTLRERLPGLQSLALDEVDALPAAGDERVRPRLIGDDPDPVLLVYTSGTTGTPKGALLTQQALLWNAVNSQVAHDLSQDDLVLTDLPLFHVGGLNIQTLPALIAGATVRLHRRFDPDAALVCIDRERPSVYLMVPATMQALLNHPRWRGTDLSSLRATMAGSSTIPVPLLQAFLDRGVAVGQIYGSTETAPIATVLPVAEAAAHLGSCGKAALHCEVRVVNEQGQPVGAGVPGEVQVRGANLMREYWNDPQATRAVFDGDWFRSGDIGHWDQAGYLYIDDRKKDVIISGGENVYPAEIENLLGKSEALAEFAVVGRTDPRWGEVAVAVVVTRPGQAFGHADTLALLRDRLARFKLPRDTVVLDALPRNAMGKILKHELRKIIAGAAHG